ncbi:MAG: PxKF domain-containing protein, partial [Candidatus Nitrosocaldus sp.]|nr:PxKF domain-containing protein [Candidatus Nitrosocaldus sp.]
LTGSTDEIELTATGNTSLRYDTTEGQFIYNWKTPSQRDTCWKVTVEFIDGSSIYAYFRLR